jgi:hypothetical protein
MTGNEADAFTRDTIPATDTVRCSELYLASELRLNSATESPTGSAGRATIGLLPPLPATTGRK